jgi:hypothetical protein
MNVLDHLIGKTVVNATVDRPSTDASSTRRCPTAGSNFAWTQASPACPAA